VCHGRIPDDLVVTSGRATSQAVSTMLDSMTSAPAPTGIEPLSLSGDVQQLAGHCTATIANGQPPRLLLVEYSMGKHRALPSACSRSRLAYPSPRPPYISVVAYSQVTVWTRGVGSWLVERLGSCAALKHEHPCRKSRYEYVAQRYRQSSTYGMLPVRPPHFVGVTSTGWTSSNAA
jgi:hypothetical protein